MTVKKPISIPVLTNIIIPSMQQQAEQLAGLGNAVSAVAQVLDAMLLLEEADNCSGCADLPPALASGYVKGGLYAALDILGGEVSRQGECLREQLREVM